MEELWDVTAVEVIGTYRLRLTFEDGTVGDVDFSADRWSLSQPPAFTFRQRGYR